MAKLFKQDTFANNWMNLLMALHNNGNITSPRGLQTREFLNVTFEVTNGLDNIIDCPLRDLNYRFLIAEWLWILAGLDDVETISKYNSIIAKYSDNGNSFSGAYGPRLCPQWPYIISSLRKEDSRQAVATIWTPSPGNSLDIPCTISLQWLVRFSELHCTITMRSSDVWLGLPHDYFNFSMITNVISAIIGVKVGSITMNLASSHLYERDDTRAYEVLMKNNFESLRSPQMSILPYFPSQEFLLSMLKQEETAIAYPWNKYALALTKNKAHALGVLHDLSRSTSY